MTNRASRGCEGKNRRQFLPEMLGVDIDPSLEDQDRQDDIEDYVGCDVEANNTSGSTRCTAPPTPQ